jgi:hypothetical protein
MKHKSIGSSGVRSPAVTMLAIAALVAGCGGGSGSGTPPLPTNAPPTVSVVAAQTINQDTSTGPLAFSVSDEGGADSVTLAVSTSNASIVPVGGIVLSGAGASRTVTITPAEDATGQLTVTITAMDAQGLAFGRVIGVTVNAVQQSVASYTTTTFAQMENDTPAQVSGFTFVQDADDETTFDSLLQ